MFKDWRDFSLLILLIWLGALGGIEEGKDKVFLELAEKCGVNPVVIERYITPNQIAIKCALVEKEYKWVEVK